MEKENIGKVIQIMGAIVDVQFNEEVPAILNALRCQLNNKTLVLEVRQHMGDGIVRTIAMDSTNGLARMIEVIDTRDTNFKLYAIYKNINSK